MFKILAVLVLTSDFANGESFVKMLAQLDNSSPTSENQNNVGLIFQRPWYSDIDIVEYDNESDSTRPQCARTNNEESPWWRVQFLREYWIAGIVLHIPAEVVDIPDIIKVKVGPSPNNLHSMLSGRLCNLYEQKLEPGPNVIPCRIPLAGTYVIIQGYSRNTQSTNKTTALALCEVEVFGRDPSEVKVQLLDDFYTVQLSSKGDNYEEYDDTCKRSGYYSKLQTQHCLQLQRDRLEMDAIYPWIKFKLHNEAQNKWIRGITLYTSARTNLTGALRVYIGNTNEFPLTHTNKPIDNNELCNAEVPLTTPTMEITCSKPLLGKYIIIQLQKICSQDKCPVYNTPLSICDIEIWGYTVDKSISNVALHKPGKQSSVLYKADAHLALNGDKYTRFYHHGTYDRPVCTHSYETPDKYPWWRVDLLVVYYVQNLTIYNRGEGLSYRLHDIDIRVGNKDIADLEMNIIFKQNFRCQSCENRRLNAGPNKIECINPVIGRFVSIQIVRFSNGATTGTNYLTLCEVEVFGYPIEKVEAAGIGLGKPVANSYFLPTVDDRQYYQTNLTEVIDILTIQPINLGISKHPWWRMSMVDEYVVTSVIFTVDKQLASLDIDSTLNVRVGYSDIREFRAQSKLTDDFGPTCIDITFNELGITSEMELNCIQPVVGKFVNVFMETECTIPSCLHALSFLQRVYVSGYKLTRHYDEIDLITTHKGDFSVTTSNGVAPEKFLEPIVLRQLETGKEEKPWIKVVLDKPLYVRSVMLHAKEKTATDDALSTHMKIIMYESSEETSEQPTTSDCIKGTYGYVCMVYKPNYVLVQTFIISHELKCSSGSTNCGTRQISLCGIDIYGIAPKYITMAHREIGHENKRVAYQSSTFSNATAKLAIDGAINMRMYAKTAVQNCHEYKGILPLECRPDNVTNSSCKFTSCELIRQHGFNMSGIYTIHLNNLSEPVKVFCDMALGGGGWTVIQRRQEFSGEQESFIKSWDEYKHGFGSLCSEFWLGNEYIFHLTQQENVDLAVKVKYKNNKVQYSFYRNFSISDQKDHYRLIIRDELATQKAERWINYMIPYVGNMFKTSDSNNESSEEEDGVGWWISMSDEKYNLNSEPYRGHVDEIDERPETFELIAVEMKIRPHDRNGTFHRR